MQEVCQLAISQKSSDKNSLSYSNIIKNILIDSVIDSANKAVEIGLKKENIILSCKTSNVRDLVEIYENLSERCKYPLHLGLTEAGLGRDAIISSVSALSILINKGIGDTIRVSLSSDPVDEIKAGFEILKSLGIRSRGVNIISCPSCARQAFPVIETVKYWRKNYRTLKNRLICR